MAETCWNTIVVSSEAFERAFSISLGFLQVEDPIKPTDGFHLSHFLTKALMEHAGV